MRSSKSWHGRFGVSSNFGREAPDPLPDLCRKFDVPLDHASANSTMLTYHVARYIVDPKIRRGAIWMLDGGPGGDGVDLMNAAPEHRSVWQFYDILVPQHRGTGLSSPLECTKPLHVSTCMAKLAADFGDTWAQHFTTTAAARDLKMAITQVQAEEGEETHIYGLSYGTYLLNRFSQIAPGQADTFTFDGICPSNQVRYVNYDDNLDTVVSQILYECQTDSYCAGRFSAKPVVETMRQAINDYRHGRGTCFQALNSSFPFKLLTQAGVELGFLSGNVGDPHEEQGTLLPAMLLRLSRCSVADITALRALLEYTAAALVPDNASTVNVLGDHIMMSELWVEPGETPPSAEELFQKTMDKDFAGWGPVHMAPERPAWHLYTPDALFGQPTRLVDKPALYLDGNADTATPLYWASYEFQRAEVQDKRFVFVDGSLHVTLMNRQCVVGMLGDFFNGKTTSAINTSRCSALLKKDFTSTSEHARNLSSRVFGTEDAWGVNEDHGSALDASLPGIIV